jgi:hypothetical protein
VDGLRDIASDRRLAILAVCAVEWHAGIADAVVETHDRIVGKTWQDAKRLCDTRIADAKSALHDTLRSFKTLGAALLEAKGDEASLDVATEMSCGWLQLEDLVATTAELTDTMTLSPMLSKGIIGSDDTRHACCVLWMSTGPLWRSPLWGRFRLSAE